MCAYFLAGSTVTRLRLAAKQAAGIAEARGGRRGPGSVYGSGAAGMAAAVGALALDALVAGTLALPVGGPGRAAVDAAATLRPALAAAFVAAFASKLADTTSSEVGKAYGRTTYLVTSLARVPRGTEGAVSLEGSGAGLAAAAAYAGLATASGLVTPSAAAAAAAAATVANLFESVLGATLQGRVAWLTNDVVNVIQTCVAAVLAGVAVAAGM